MAKTIQKQHRVITAALSQALLLDLEGSLRAGDEIVNMGKKRRELVFIIHGVKRALPIVTTIGRYQPVNKNEDIFMSMYCYSRANQSLTSYSDEDIKVVRKDRLYKRCDKKLKGAGL